MPFDGAANRMQAGAGGLFGAADKFVRYEGALLVGTALQYHDFAGLPAKDHRDSAHCRSEASEGFPFRSLPF